jgi:hypothetical protein
VRAHLAADEDDHTAGLIRALRQARARGYLTRPELEAICRWKSPRAIWHVRSNSRAAVREATSRVLRSRSEWRRVSALIELRGVSVPMASAVLTLLDPRRYGVIDIRVWQLLHELGHVSGNRAGRSLTVAHWLQFLSVVRRVSAALEITARQAEKALFDIHRAHQRGTLYAPAKASR